MPRVNWGVGKEVIDEYDRDSQFTPYRGKTPPNGVYKFKVKTLKSAAGTKTKNPRLTAGLELVPRDADEKPFKGYYIPKFMAIADTNGFQWIPFLDAIGVSSAEFLRGTVTDEDGNVRKIGNWKMDGTTEILAQLADGTDQNDNPRKEIKWVGALDDEEGFADEVEEDEEVYDDDDEGF